MELFQNCNVVISKNIYMTQEKSTKPIYKWEQVERADNFEQTLFDL